MKASSINWLLVILVFGLFIIQGYWIAHSLIGKVPPVTVLEAKADKSEIVYGEPLYVWITSRRLRVCLTNTDRFFFHGNDVIHRERVVGISAKPGATITRRVRVQLPTFMEPGEYTFRATLFSDCGSGVVYATEQPEVAFTILARP